MEYCTIILSILISVFAIYYYFSSKNTNVFDKHGIPYMKPESFLRRIITIFVFPKPYVEFVEQIYNVDPNAKYVGIFDFNKPTVLLRDLELLKSVAIKNFDFFEDHVFFGSGNQDPLFQNNLISLRGNIWRELRALLSPSFTSSKMKTMFQLITECAVSFSEYLTNVPYEKRTMEMKDIFTRYANDVIATCAFGIEVDSMRNPKNDFYMYGKKATNFNLFVILKILLSQHAPMISRLLNLKIVDDRTSAFFINLISNTIKVRDEKNIIRPDMLQLLMDSRGKRGTGRELTIEEMTSQAFIFFVAGFDTSSTLMSFAAHEIAVNPDIQEKLRHDIDKVLDDTMGQVSYEAINGMTYLNAVINETLRMYTPTPMMDRLCVKDFELPPTLPDAKPFLMKKGMLAFIPFYALHHDNKYFPEPKKFKPERFLDESGDYQSNLDAYHPFGIGPRMCLGNRFALLETKVLLFHLLARCELETCEKTPIPIKFKKEGFTVVPEGGFWLNIVPRKKRHPAII